jgi:hypothetical protein
MAWQLIYTSAPRGLVAGRSGFCTVARHREIRDGLVTAIERFSQYDRSGRAAGSPSPVVYAHRIVRLGGSSFHVLSCTRDAGADYTGRTNHLAHHLICEPHELANAPSPAEVLRQMAWQRVWTDAPRYFGLEEVVDLRRFHRTAELPALTWQGVTGDAGCAAMPLESGALAGCFWLYPAEAGEQHLLPLVAESLLLLDPSGRSPEKLWQVPFTTYLQATDHAADFFWRGCWQGAPAANAAQSARQTLDFTQPRNLRAPENQIADMARRGRTAAPEKTAVAPAAAVTPMETAPPVALADSSDLHLDLAELLASADKADPTRRAPPPNVASPVAGKGSVTRSAGRSHAGERKAPIKIILAVGAAVVVCGALAIGFVVWRDGKAEQIRGELLRARSGGDFALGLERVPTIWRVLRTYKPLEIEIERTQVAAELNGLKDKTVDEAKKYLNSNSQRFEKLLWGEFEIKKRREAITKWIEADEHLGTLKRRIEAANSSKPTTDNPIEKKDFTNVKTAIDALDKPYQSTITSQFNEVKERYDKLDEQRRKQATAVVPAPPAKPAPAGQAPAKPEEPKHALGLPEMTTYIAASSVIGFDISGVTEMQGGKEFRADGKWLLLRNPQPALSPQNATSDECSLIEGKLYMKTVLLFTPKQRHLVMDSKAKEVLPERFLLRFTPNAGAESSFQILFHLGDQKSQALLRLPTSGSLVWDQKISTITLSAELANALRMIKLAGSSNSELLFRAARWDDRMVLGDVGTEVRLSVPAISKVVGLVETQTPISKPSKTSPTEERVRAAKAARDFLTNKPPPKDVRTYVESMQTLFRKLLEEIESERASIDTELPKLNVTKKGEKEKNASLTIRRNQLALQRDNIIPILKNFEMELEKEWCGDAVVIWTGPTFFPKLGKLQDPSRKFYNDYVGVFNKEYLAKINPFLEWNKDGKDGNLDKAFAALEAAQQAPSKPIEGKDQSPPEKPPKDITSLGPFYIELKAAGGTAASASNASQPLAIRLVNFIDGPSVVAAEPVKNPK